MIAAVFGRFCTVTFQTIAVMMVLGLVFTLLAMVVAACNKSPPWWRKPDLATDLCWAVVPRLLYGYAQTFMLTLGVAAFYGIHDPDQFFAEGHGPLAGIGFWPQIVAYLLGNDLVMYTTHRLFHTARLWRFHAIHHSSHQLDWISSVRFHPVDQIFHSILADVVMLLLGIPPEILLWLMPFSTGTAALVHANLDWSFGPFRYVLASPVFHRWHHTSADRGGSSNFAGTFPVLDLIFGTFYFPAGQRPDEYGVDDPHFPAHFAGQLIHPFARSKSPDPVNVTAEL